MLDFRKALERNVRYNQTRKQEPYHSRDPEEDQPDRCHDTVREEEAYRKMNVLRTENLKKYYGSGDNQVKALDGISLSVEQGEFLAVVGTSGSGKSTLLHMLGGLDRPTSGKVYVDGKDISGLKDDALCIFRRRKIGFVFQSYNLVPVLNVYENIVFPIELDGNETDKDYVERVIEALGLKAKLASLPGQLSGGQQQRVAIARALAAKPAILLADDCEIIGLTRKNPIKSRVLPC